MDRVTARVRLSNMVAAASSPVLAAVDVDALLDSHAIPDSAGLLTTDVGYATTWDLNAAAAEGWRWKGAKVAGDYTFSADGASYDKGKVMANCLEMEAKYASLGHGTMEIGGRRYGEHFRDLSPYDVGSLLP